jgi:hypothetical protein
MGPGATALMLGVMFLFLVAILVLVAIFYKKARSSGGASGRCRCPSPWATGPTGCYVLNPRNGCSAFFLTQDFKPGCGADSQPTLPCLSGVLTVKSPLSGGELILTASMPTGTIVTDIFAQVVPALCGSCAKVSDFGQTGCTVSTSIGYTAFSFDCTGGSNVQTVTLPLSTGMINRSHAFLSVVVGATDVCGTPLLVDTFTIEGRPVPTPRRGCPRPALTPGCNQPVPRYAYIKIPASCCAPV